MLELELPDLAARIEADHTTLEQRVDRLRDLAAVAVGASDAGRRQTHRLYLELASFTSDYLAHQDVEDAVNELCRDRQAEELDAIERLVLDHSVGRITIERAWTIATGFETDPFSIPAVTELLYAAENVSENSAAKLTGPH